MANLHVLS